MKRHMLTRGALAAGLALALSACAEGLTDVNDNPNAPTDVGPEFLLPQSIRSGVENTYGRMMMAHTAIWPQHMVELQYPDEERGNVRPGTIQGFWDSYYAGSLRDIQNVIDKAVEDQTPNVEAVGMIWQTWIYSQMTDLWGDIPYSEALKADDGNTTPAYDSQQAVYAGMIQTLKDAVAKLDPAGDGFGSGDILYGNDFTKWARFANSLRMRLAMRLSEVSASTAQAEFVAAYNAGGFQSNADNAMIEWAGPPYDPLMYEDWQTRDDFGISRTIVDTLKFLTDPRLELYAEPAAADGQYRGLQNNVAVPPLSIANYSRIGDFWRADGQGTPTAIMTYSEVLFLQAEAVARTWIAGTVATVYENAIRANMNQYDAWSPANAPTDAEINAYVAQPSVVYSNLDQIHLQKWIALYLNGGEAWFNQRRTGVPNLQPGPDLLLSRIPVRFMYPAGEQSLNKASMDAAVQRQGGGLDLVSLIWWDVQ